MPWLKLLHISAVIIWCGALLYLPFALAAAAGADRPALLQGPGRRLPRTLFTLVATPAALLAIASGSLIFLLQGPLALWLATKLALVGLLVLSHACCGLLILRIERGQPQRVRLASGGVAAASLLWLGAIAWLVLGKPF